MEQMINQIMSLAEHSRCRAVGANSANKRAKGAFRMQIDWRKYFLWWYWALLDTRWILAPIALPPISPKSQDKSVALVCNQTERRGRTSYYHCIKQSAHASTWAIAGPRHIPMEFWYQPPPNSVITKGPFFGFLHDTFWKRVGFRWILVCNLPKNQIFSSRVRDHVSVLPQVSEQTLGHQIDSAARCKSLYDSRASI